MLRLWPDEDERRCCSPESLRRAREVARTLGVPFHEIAAEDDFSQHVVEPFVRSYLEGETPNPCVDCNPRRLSKLVRLADRLGLRHVATGHYARLVWRDGEPYVARAADGGKDQSYMLWRVPPDVLARLEFPLGDSYKSDVRGEAGRAGLAVAAQRESQEVCFATRGYRRFLEERGVPQAAGAIVDRSGRVRGTHDGQWRYTIGQRRGLGIAEKEPFYVLERRVASNEVVVGGRVALEVDRVIVRQLVDRGIDSCRGLTVQLRYRSSPVPVRACERLAGDRIVVHLARPFEAPAPGQSAVFYRDDIVVGGGILASGPAVAQRV